MSRTIWLTGLSGAGKTTIAHELKKYIPNSIILDGDEIRKGLNKDLSFSDEDRRENVRRIAELCKLLNNNKLNAIVSVISPFEEDRNMAKECIGKGFLLCYLKCSLEKCEERDVKGLYKKANEGELLNFTGVQGIYQFPKSPDITLDTENLTVQQCIDEFFYKLKGT